MNYEEELRSICEEKRHKGLFIEDKGLKEIKNSIKKIAIQNENINQDYIEEIYRIANSIEGITSYINQKSEEEELRSKRINKELEIREKRFVKSLINIIDNIKYIYDFSLKSNNDMLVEAMNSLFNIVKKIMINVDILIIDGKETFFDESLHECVSTIWDNNREDYEITEVLKLGYIYKGKVERVAQVVVVKNKEDI
ncbi:TPA: nucleotide exchange factor GrpE [Clostridium perfringens]